MKQTTSKISERDLQNYKFIDSVIKEMEHYEKH